MSDWLTEYKAKLRRVEKLLHECEALSKRNGKGGVVGSPVLASKDKVMIPFGYVRSVGSFRKNYKLRKIIDGRYTQNNIAAAFQVIDLFSFINNTFALVDLTPANVFHRIGTSHVVSIIEAIFRGYVNSLHSNCAKDGITCKKSSKCKYYFKSASKYSFEEVIELLLDRGIICSTEINIKRLMKLRSITDSVHMWDAGGDDYHDIRLGIDTYHEAISVLATIRDSCIESFQGYMSKQASECPKAVADAMKSAHSI